MHWCSLFRSYRAHRLKICPFHTSFSSLFLPLCLSLSHFPASARLPDLSPAVPSLHHWGEGMWRAIHSHSPIAFSPLLKCTQCSPNGSYKVKCDTKVKKRLPFTSKKCMLSYTVAENELVEVQFPARGQVGWCFSHEEVSVTTVLQYHRLCLTQDTMVAVVQSKVP